MESGVVFRGVQSTTSEFVWEAPDGTGLLTIYLPGGYYNGMELARPDHGFRAALQEHLVEKGIRDEVIDALVGHVGKSTRSRHYSGPAALFQAVREVVDALPAIDWKGKAAEGEQPDNVVQMRRG